MLKLQNKRMHRYFIQPLLYIISITSVHREYLSLLMFTFYQTIHTAISERGTFLQPKRVNRMFWMYYLLISCSRETRLDSMKKMKRKKLLRVSCFYLSGIRINELGIDLLHDKGESHYFRQKNIQLYFAIIGDEQSIAPLVIP